MLLKNNQGILEKLRSMNNSVMPVHHNLLNTDRLYIKKKVDNQKHVTYAESVNTSRPQIKKLNLSNIKLSFHEDDPTLNIEQPIVSNRFKHHYIAVHHPSNTYNQSLPLHME